MREREISSERKKIKAKNWTAQKFGTIWEARVKRCRDINTTNLLFPLKVYSLKISKKEKEENRVAKFKFFENTILYLLHHRTCDYVCIC